MPKRSCWNNYILQSISESVRRRLAIPLYTLDFVEDDKIRKKRPCADYEHSHTITCPEFVSTFYVVLVSVSPQSSLAESSSLPLNCPICRRAGIVPRQSLQNCSFPQSCTYRRLRLQLYARLSALMNIYSIELMHLYP
jgi:hypothetical protein